MEGDGEDEIGSGDDQTDEKAVQTRDEKGVMDVNDSPIIQSKMHKPIAHKEKLVALLVVKDPYHISDMVPFYKATISVFLRGSCRLIILCKF